MTRGFRPSVARIKLEFTADRIVLLTALSVHKSWIAAKVMGLPSRLNVIWR
jgi:hypothetical protein